MTSSDLPCLLAQLSPAHAVALRLHGAGHADDVLATALDVPVGSVPTLLEVARIKLALLVGEQDDAPDQNQWSTSKTQWSTTEAEPPPPR